MFGSCTWKFYNLAKLTTWLEQQEVTCLTLMAASWLPVPHLYNTLLSFLFQEDSCYNTFLCTKLGISRRRQDPCTYRTLLYDLNYPPISILILILHKYLRFLSLHHPLFRSGMYKSNLKGKYYHHSSSDYTPEPGLKNFFQNYSPPKIPGTQNIRSPTKNSKGASAVKPFTTSLHINHQPRRYQSILSSHLQLNTLKHPQLSYASFYRN